MARSSTIAARQTAYRTNVARLAARGFVAGSTVVLARAVRNPQPDRRRPDWYAAPQVPAGTRFTVIDDGPPGTPVIKLRRHAGRDLSITSALFDALLPHLKLAPQTLTDILEAPYGNVSQAAREVLFHLVDHGRVSIDDVRQAIAARAALDSKTG